MNNIRKKMPEELIPKNSTYYVKNGNKIRKGTMASFILNIEILESDESTPEEKNEAVKILEKLAPTLYLFGLNKHFIFRNRVFNSILSIIKHEK